MTKYLMFQGTSSHVGKSILTTALCRIFFREGRRVVPFKAQNMALNSFVTADGLEMGRAQVAQAEAANLAPRVEMNPVLLKPTGNATSQVIINGRAIGVMSAADYHQGYSLKAFEAVKTALQKLSAEFDTIIIEGAGSPAEVNLKANDIVNMRVAKYLNAPVILVADIDRGGALASLVGTLELLDDDERELVKGLVINKFRGDVNLLLPAVDFLENKTGKPVLGIVPFIEKLGIDDEDSVSLDDKISCAGGEINIAVIRLSKLSNFTDFDSLAGEADVNLFYATEPDELDAADVIILPGSKNTSEDLISLRKNNFAEKILRRAEGGAAIVGICGGFQMLGEKIFDPLKTESNYVELDGLKLLPIETTFTAEKFTRQIFMPELNFTFLNQNISAKNLEGYEIHSGESNLRGQKIISDKNIFGTYVHGIFDNDDFRRKFLNAVRLKKNLPPLTSTRNVRAEKQKNYERLANIVRQSLNMDLLEKIISQDV
ncbi:MAG: cobyric acid synthase [Selenomonadaceae bacterium]|nr:cobyric acid synthase [Selenomonadaceae bacterium]